MSIEPGERRRRRALEPAREAPVTGPVTPHVPHQAAPPAAEDDRPPTRRELRERDRRRVSEAAPKASEGPTAPDVDPSTPRAPVEAAGAHPAAHEDDVDHHEPHRYAWPHALALAGVALVLGFLVWSQTTHPSGTGAVGAASPTTSPSAPPAAPRGEL